MPQENHKPSASLEMLQFRASMLRRTRAFFDSLGFMEVETPILSNEVIPETHIEPMRCTKGKQWLWMQASPEAHMKRLLASGATAIYQIGRAFRSDEEGPLHKPEFTMLEWYRTGDSMESAMAFLDSLCQAVLFQNSQTAQANPPAIQTTYRQAFLQYANVDPFSASDEELLSLASDSSNATPENWTRDDCLDLLLVNKVEPNLGRDRLEILYHYPKSQAALAKTCTDDNGREVAERFELYWKGIELANGYHELADADELTQRFSETNQQRVALGKEAIPMPKAFLAAMKSGMPDASGVAFGFDRLVMLAAGAKTIDEVVAFN